MSRDEAWFELFKVALTASAVRDKYSAEKVVEAAASIASHGVAALRNNTAVIDPEPAS
jgi:truncated hemoglobin YjbI